MFLGLDGVEIGLIIVFLCLFGGILSGFPVAFALGGAGLIAFGIIAALDSSGLLVHEYVDRGSEGYRALLAEGHTRDQDIEVQLSGPSTIRGTLVPAGWEVAMDRNIAFIVNRMNERVFAGQSIETLLAVLMFVIWASRWNGRRSPMNF